MFNIRYVFVVGRHQMAGDAKIVRKAVNNHQPHLLGIEHSGAREEKIIIEEQEEVRAVAQLEDQISYNQILANVRSDRFAAIIGDEYDHQIEILRVQRKLHRYFLERYSDEVQNALANRNRYFATLELQRNNYLRDGKVSAAMSVYRQTIAAIERYNATRDRHMVENLMPKKIEQNLKTRLPNLLEVEQLVVCPIVGDQHLPVAEEIKNRGYEVDIMTQHKPHLLWNHDQAIQMARAQQLIPDGVIIRAMAELAIDRVLKTPIMKACEGSNELVLFYRLIAEGLTDSEIAVFLCDSQSPKTTLERLMRKHGIELPNKRAKLLKTLKEKWPTLAIT